jgi:hypothetical protein
VVLVQCREEVRVRPNHLLLLLVLVECLEEALGRRAGQGQVRKSRWLIVGGMWVICSPTPGNYLSKEAASTA